MRILYQAILVRRDEDKPSFNEWFRELRIRGLKDVLAIKDAIRLLGGDPQKKSVLAVDEANKLQERGTTKIGAEMAMANVIGTLGQTMSNSQIFSFMARTLIDTFTIAARKSGIGIAITYLSLLTSAQQSAILDNAERLAGWRCYQEGRILLSKLGGLPRLIEAFITAILAAQPNGVTFNDISWPDVERHVRNSVVANKLYWGNHTDASELARPLIDVIILRKPVQSNWSVLPGHPDTYESLQQNSQIVLQAHPLDANLFIPTMPFIAFQSLVQTAREKVTTRNDDSDRFKHLYTFMNSSPTTWQSFEKFAIKYTTLMNEFFANADEDPLPLYRRYATGYGDANGINITFLTKSPKTMRCHRRFPKTSSIVNTNGSKCDFADGNCYLNAPGARFGDGFYVCGEAIDDMFTDVTNSEDEDMDNDDDFERSTTRRPSKLCIVEQYKDQQSLMTFAKCIDEHEKNKDSWENAEKIESKEDYRLITVIISTGKVAPPEEDQYISQDNLQDLLVVDVTMFDIFYGIFNPLLRLLPPTETHRLTINTADWATLRRTFGEVGANTVRDIRRDGFKDRSDFEARLLGAGESTEEWKQGWKETLDICEF